MQILAGSVLRVNLGIAGAKLGFKDLWHRVLLFNHHKGALILLLTLNRGININVFLLLTLRNSIKYYIYKMANKKKIHKYVCVCFAL